VERPRVEAAVKALPARLDARCLAAIHLFAVGRAPRLERLLPARGREGDPLLLTGEGFCGAALCAHFGAVPAAGLVVLSNREAVAIVPAGASAGPFTVSRHGLRSNPLAFGGPDGEGPRVVLRVDPHDGAAGVFRDAPVVLRLSHPARVEVGHEPVEVLDDRGPVPGATFVSPDGLVLVWRGLRPLRPEAVHFVATRDLRDREGRAFAPHLSRFLPCGVGREDLGP
jgi:hypothetical protein